MNKPAEALGGLRVVELWPTLAGALAGQLLADFGAEVIFIEPRGGSPLREEPAFAFWARGKKSIELDLHDAADRAVARSLLQSSDVAIDTFRPGVAESLGLGYAQLSETNPSLVHASITGFGRRGPCAATKGYEGLVFAKAGGSHAFAPAASRPGPAFASVNYCSWSAAQTALHGILAALFERERSGLGQAVETSMLKAISSHDPYNWFFHVLMQRYPDAYSVGAAFTTDGEPVSPLPLYLLTALSKDGHWLQFSQVGPHLYRALMRSLGLEWMFDVPEWATIPKLPDQAARTALWERMLEAVRERTVAEWQEIFEKDHDLWAEPFRAGKEVFDHAQLVHDGFIVAIDDPEGGTTLQPGALIQMAGTPARLDRPAPSLNQHGEQLRCSLASPGTGFHAVHAEPAIQSPRPQGPLAGITVLEFGIFLAGPYATTLLTDLGARVIKIEPIEGDPIRSFLPFPEAGGVKLLQGKESVTVDIRTEDGRKIVHALVLQADIVLQSFRADKAERVGVDARTLREINPNLVYLNAPGYGADGPCGDRPAFAATVGAAGGIALRNLGASLASGSELSLADIKAHAFRLAVVGFSSFSSSDGLSALGNTTALLLGLLARQRGKGAQVLTSSMLSTVTHVVAESMVYSSQSCTAPVADAGLHGFSALYRLYETSAGWIFLAAPKLKEWPPLAQAMSPYADLAGDPRFADESARSINDSALAGALGAIFRGRSALEWERDLTADDVGCVAVTEEPEAYMQSDEFGRASGLLVDVVHPTFDEHPRLAPLVEFSRSATTPKSGCLLGEHTDAVLAELGYGEAVIGELRSRGIIGP